MFKTNIGKFLSIVQVHAENEKLYVKYNNSQRYLFVHIFAYYAEFYIENKS